jgi:hypothetical protein
MSRTYIPPSKRKAVETVATIDPETLNNMTLFPTLGTQMAAKATTMQFKAVVNDQIEEEKRRLDQEKMLLEHTLLLEGEFDKTLNYSAMSDEEIAKYGLWRRRWVTKPTSKTS